MTRPFEPSDHEAAQVAAAADVHVDDLTAFATTRGLTVTDAAELLRLENAAAEIRAKYARPKAPAPWLDIGQLTTPPRPWSDDDWERDRRRALVAGIELDRATWATYAELGQDAVHEILEEREAEELRAVKWAHAVLVEQQTIRDEERRAYEREVEAAMREQAEREVAEKRRRAAHDAANRGGLGW